MEAYLTCLCWFANVIIEWTNCDSMLGTLLDNMLMLMCTCGCQMNKIVIWCFKAYSMTCLCWFANVIWCFKAYSMTCLCWFANVIWCFKAYSMTCLCWFANVIIKWTNCDSMLGTLLNNMLMLICTCGCQMNKIVIRHLKVYSMTCLCWLAHVFVKCTNYDSTLQHVNLHI